MSHACLAALLLVAGATAPSADLEPSCSVQRGSVVGVSPSGVPQVSNLALIGLEARVPRRPIPGTGVQHGLKVQVTAHAISARGSHAMIASSTQEAGGGGDSKTERVSFYLDIPIDVAERDAAIRKYVAALSQEAASGQRHVDPATGEAFKSLFRQHRLGKYSVLCRIVDDGKTLGEARTDLEVVFRGNFFEQDAFRTR